MNATVNASRGLKKFFFYLFLSGCLGLFANYYIQKKLQQFWNPVAAQLSQSGLEVSAPRMVYARTGLPVFGAQLDIVRYEKQWRCFNGTVTVKDVFVPFSLYQLLSQKRIKFGEVDVAQLKIEFLEDPACHKIVDTDTGEGPLAPPAAEQVFAEIEQRARKELTKHSANTSTPEWVTYLDKWFLKREDILAKNPLSSLVIHTLTIEAHTLEDKALNASGYASLSFKDHFNAKMTLKPLVLRKREKSLATEFNAQMSADAENVQVLADWGFHEGHFTMDLGYNKSENAKILLKSRDLPVSVLNKWLDTSWSFQFLWFNCEVALDTTQQTWQQSLWAIRGCRMDGPNGKITMADTETSTLKNPKDIKIEINNLDLDKIVHGRDNLVLSGVFKGFGQLQGLIEFKNDRWSSKFKLLNPQVVFSSDNKRRLQPIEQMNFDGSYDSGIYSLKLTSADIVNGEFKGVFSLDYNDRLGLGNGKVDVQKLSFDNEVEDLMFSGQLSPLSAVGDFEINRQWQLKKAQGKINFKEFEGRHVELGSTSILADWNPEIMRVTSTATQVKVIKEGKGQWLLGSLLKKAPESDLSLYQIHTQGHYSADMFVLENLVGTSGPLRLEFNGTYRKEGVQGSFTWQEKSDILQKWKWILRKKEILLVPQLPKTREWLQTHPDFLTENPYIFIEEKEI